jgi:hypothetical protein
MYTANVVDTVIFRSLGKPPGPQWQSLKRAVDTAETELWVPASIYQELANAGTDPPMNPYLDGGIEAGWIRVGTPLPDRRSDAFDTVADPVLQARHLADEFLNRESKYPKMSNWQDASMVALAVRLFEHNTRIRVITHTADEPLAKACARVPPEFGYYDIESRYYNPPKTAKNEFPTPKSLNWGGR